MIIQTFPSGPFQTNAYLVVCSHTQQAAIIDPAPGSFDAITTFLNEKNIAPVGIWLTHSHWDHIADVAPLKEKYKIPVAIHPLDLPNLESPGADQLPCWIDIQGVSPEIFIQEGSILKVGDLQFEVIHTPGHTPGGICLYCTKENCLISGDTLFKGTIGNLSFPTARPKLMWQSLDKLARLPADTQVFPGHGPSTTIGAEKWLSRAQEIFGN